MGWLSHISHTPAPAEAQRVAERRITPARDPALSTALFNNPLDLQQLQRTLFDRQTWLVRVSEDEWGLGRRVHVLRFGPQIEEYMVIEAGAPFDCAWCVGRRPLMGQLAWEGGSLTGWSTMTNALETRDPARWARARAPLPTAFEAAPLIANIAFWGTASWGVPMLLVWFSKRWRSKRGRGVVKGTIRPVERASTMKKM